MKPSFAQMQEEGQSAQSESSPAEDETKFRTIYINDHVANIPFRYPRNEVTTAKYTLLTFFPKNLFEQFCRLANIYFIIISALQLIPGISPTGQWNTLGPFLFVLGVTAMKEAYEDVRRHQQDTKVNNTATQILRENGAFEPAIWSDVKTGDIVRVANRQFIPADLVVLASSEPQGMCYIETANLDGETNLKVRQALDETLFLNSVEELHNFKAAIKCEHPNNRLYNFDGNITFHNQVYALGVKQILLRGALLRNTKWVYGVVIFSGDDTKLVRNSGAAPVKRSNLERVTNKQVLLIFAFQLALVSLCTIINRTWVGSHLGAWYLQWDQTPDQEAGWAWITFLILYNNLIPISLYVTVEVVKFVQAYLINTDLKMYYERNDTPAMARTSNLNEELGQVQYIFSDKTGTLTQNLMAFRKCSIAGIAYGSSVEGADSGSTKVDNVNFHDPRLLENLKSSHPTADTIREFLTLLSLCHTVIPEEEDGKLVYQASSPDEAALVNAARFFGFQFVGRTTKSMTVQIFGSNVEYELLNILEFNSMRKRMSVIVRTPAGKILLYVKGADTVIYERLRPDQPYGDATINHLQEFASEGLRTLCVAVTEITPERYEEWNKGYKAASVAMVGRDAQLDRAAEAIEKNLFLLGATAIEDKLQDGVPETIHTLASAGIKIWVLTGDKQETAINIGFACQLLNDQMEIVVLNEGSPHATRDELLRTLALHHSQFKNTQQQQRKSRSISTSSTSSRAALNNEYATTSSSSYPPSPLSMSGAAASPQPAAAIPQMALVIDGHTLTYALDDELRESFLALACNCVAVICCRVSPLQKAMVVSLVRESLDAITLAVGDGANDVSMIQAAHVGVGISGEEGLQAARASDYSIGQFRFLVRLLLVHGRHSYRRVAKVILYSFYKNITLYLVQFWFTIFNGWSGETFFERTTLTLYNIAWTVLPVVALGVFDKDVSDRMLVAHPQLYHIGIDKYHYNSWVFWGWVLNAMYHSLICFGFVALAFMYEVPYHTGHTEDLFSMGTASFTCVVVVVTLKLALETRYWTWINHLTTWGSIVVYACWLMVWSAFYGGTDIGSDMWRVVFHLYTSPEYYFSIIGATVVCLFRDFSWKFLLRHVRPKSYHIAQELDVLDKRERKGSDNLTPRPIYTGYSFAQESGEAENMKRYGNASVNV